MGKMIDLDAAIDTVQDVVSLPVYEFSVLCDKLEELAVDAEPVKHGRWMKMGDADYICSVCGFRFTSGDPITKFAHCRCGAKMDLEGE